MRIDWDALLPPAAKQSVSDGGANEEQPDDEVVPLAAGMLSRERGGDDRRRCTECGNLGERGLCLAAHRGEIVAIRNYFPVRDILRRCEGFMPLPFDPDQRHGRDKWGHLIAPRRAQQPSESVGNDAPS